MIFLRNISSNFETNFGFSKDQTSRLPYNTLLNFYSPYLTRYYSIFSTETKLSVPVCSSFSMYPIQITCNTNNTQSDEKILFIFQTSIKNSPYRIMCSIFPASHYYDRQQRFAVVFCGELRN